MSHFCALVIVTPDSPDIEMAVRHLLAPYDMGMDVEPYFDECICVSTISDEASLSAEQPPHPGWKDQQHYREFAGEKPSCEAFTREWQADPECEDCHGSGTCLTTANPNGQWDWWRIGGRWTGALVSQYDPRQEIENQEWCDLCGGTGNRPDIEYYANPDNIPATVYAINANPSAAESCQEPALAPLQMPQAGHQRVEWCNGCQGKGLRTKWPTEWKRFAGDMLPVRQIPATFFPFAIVLPNGEWLEQEEASTVRRLLHEKNIHPPWQQTIQEILTAYADHIGVVVDCHW